MNHPYRTPCPVAAPARPTRATLAPVAMLNTALGYSALVGLVATLVTACAATPGRPRTWDYDALVSIHVAAHGVQVADSAASVLYEHTTDQIAADGGPGGAQLRGAAYVNATRDLDRRYGDFLRAAGGARAGLALAEALVRQARAAGDAPAQCRAGMALDDAVADLGMLATYGDALGLTSGVDIIGNARDLARMASPLLQHCDGDADAADQDASHTNPAALRPPLAAMFDTYTAADAGGFQ